MNLTVGRLVVTCPGGGGVPDVAFEAGQDDDSALFGSPGHRGTLYDLLA